MSWSTAQIEEKASQLLSSPAFQSTPVDVIGVATSLGINVAARAMEDQASGMLVIKGSESFIIYNALHHPNRQRFTVAHEIGHFVLHHKQAGDRLFVDEKFATYQRAGASTSLVYTADESTTSPQEEREANQFASALLIPRTRLQTYLESRHLAELDDYDLGNLAKAFGVSEQAMSLRATRLKLIQLTE